jgi:hypothetical protein
VRNQEQQYYTNARSENARVQNGVLTITGKKESYPNSDYIKGSTGWQHKDSLAQYTSASINTNQKAEWQYGRIEVKAKLPHGGGIWPAIWMMGIDRERIGWPGCGEIDIIRRIFMAPFILLIQVPRADIVRVVVKRLPQLCKMIFIYTLWNGIKMPWISILMISYFIIL